MADEIRVNGNQHSWGSIFLKFDGDRYFGFTAINFSDSRERVKAHGMGRHQGARGRSRGKYDTEHAARGANQRYVMAAFRHQEKAHEHI